MQSTQDSTMSVFLSKKKTYIRRNFLTFRTLAMVYTIYVSLIIMSIPIGNKCATIINLPCSIKSKRSYSLTTRQRSTTNKSRSSLSNIMHVDIVEVGIPPCVLAAAPSIHLIVAMKEDLVRVWYSFSFN